MFIKSLIVPKIVIVERDIVEDNCRIPTQLCCVVLSALDKRLIVNDRKYSYNNHQNNCPEETVIYPVKYGYLKEKRIRSPNDQSESQYHKDVIAIANIASYV